MEVFVRSGLAGRNCVAVEKCTLNSSSRVVLDDRT